MVISQALVRELMRHFLRVAGYGGPEPRIYLRQDDEFRRAALRHGPLTTHHRNFALSIIGPVPPKTWINCSRHTNLEELEDTLAHEVTHIATGLAIHNKRFVVFQAGLLKGRQP